MNKKYELTDETIEWYGRTLYRIRAVKDFRDVKKGELGGYVQGEHNLSHYDDCWIYDNAKVYDDAFVCNSAIVFDNARASGNATVSGNAIVCNNAIVRNSARICNSAIVFDNAIVSGNAIVFDNVRASGNAIVSGYAIVSDNAFICNNAEVGGNVRVGGNAYIKENAYIENNNDFLCIGQIGSRNDYTTFYLDKDKNIYVSCGCFNETIDKFEKAVEKTHGDNEYGKQYKIAIETVERMLALDN